MHLFRHLFSHGVLATGTALETWRDFPQNLKNSKVWPKGRRGDQCGGRDPPCLALQWVDNKVVSMLTTSRIANDTVEKKRKTKTGGKWDEKKVAQPEVFSMYSQYMNAVDRSDQILGTHNVQRKCMRWWKTFFSPY